MGLQSEKATVHLVMHYSTVSKLLATPRFKTWPRISRGPSSAHCATAPRSRARSCRV